MAGNLLVYFLIKQVSALVLAHNIRSPRSRRTVHNTAGGLPELHEGRDPQNAADNLSTRLDMHATQPTRPGQPGPTQAAANDASRFVNTAFCLLYKNQTLNDMDLDIMKGYIQPGDEHHLVFGCQGLQHIRNKYLDLFGHHAETMLQFMRQADLHGAAKYVTDCLGVYCDIDLKRAPASDQP